MKLNIECEFLDHPYAHEPGSKGEQWSKIRLEILDDNGRLVKTAIDWQWDIIVFLSWLIENEEALQYENIPDEIKGTSIAKGVFNFYKKLDPNEEDMTVYNKIYEYRERHDLWFGLRGTDIHDIYMGLNDGRVTISTYNKKGRWDYNINVGDFFKKVHSIYKELRPNNI